MDVIQERIATITAFIKLKNTKFRMMSSSTNNMESGELVMFFPLKSKTKIDSSKRRDNSIDGPRRGAHMARALHVSEKNQALKKTSISN